MTKSSQSFHLVSIPLSRPAQASLKELRARARRLRTAIAREADLQKIVDVFSDGLMDQDLFIGRSEATDDARFAAILGPEGPLGSKFPGEVFHSQLCYVRELELFHAALFSGKRMGFAFQFAGDQQGVIALCTPGPDTRTDCFRYTVVLEGHMDPRAPTFRTPGGSA